MSQCRRRGKKANRAGFYIQGAYTGYYWAVSSVAAPVPPEVESETFFFPSFHCRAEKSSLSMSVGRNAIHVYTHIYIHTCTTHGHTQARASTRAEDVSDIIRIRV